MENQLSIGAVWSGLGARLASSGLPSGLLALLAFLPLAGLALISPGQVQADNSREFLLAAVLLSRVFTPPVAALMVAYLARKEGRLPAESSLVKLFRANAFPSVGLVLGVAIFTFVSGFLLVVPGVAFALATCIVLPVLVVEGVHGPPAVKRSWELTRGHRWQLLMFWSGLFLASALFLLLLFAVSTDHVAGLIEPLPLVQHAAFLPMVVGLSFVYGVVETASSEIYTRLVPHS